jgi:hypothetical protein
MNRLKLRSTFLAQMTGALFFALTLIGSWDSFAAAAPDHGNDWVEAMVDLYSDRCSDAGGTATVHYNLTSSGDIENVELTCSTPIPAQGWYCAFWYQGDWSCAGHGVFIRPEEWDEQTGFGYVQYAEAGENPIATVTVDLDRTEERPRVTGRSTVTSAPTPVAGR